MSEFNLGAALQTFRENSEITVLDPGTYTLECTSAKAGSTVKGPTITPVFKVVGGPLNGKRVMVGKMSFAEGALWKTIPQVRGFGITDEFMQMADSQPNPIETIADAMTGRVVEATVTVEPWQGEDRNKLSSVKVAEGAASGPVAPPISAPDVAPPAQPQIVSQPDF